MYYRVTALLAVSLLIPVASSCGGSSSTPHQQEISTEPVQNRVSTTVATYHNDNLRTGTNTTESTLTPVKVNPQMFGRVGAIPVQGQIYAQPLYVPNVQANGQAVHDLVIVATEHDQVYAIDADSKTIVWNKDFLGSSGTVTPVPASDTNCNGIIPEIGITGTPVIDTSTNTMYLVARTKEVQNGQAVYYQRLHALDIRSGQDTEPATSITSPTGNNGEFGVAQFDPVLNNQRSALLLANGEIYISWASHCDSGTYQGWVMAFDETTLQPTAAWTAEPSGGLGGVWMSGGGPAADGSGDIYFSVGNGNTDVMLGGLNYGDSTVRLHASGNEFSVTDYFTPFDFQMLDDDDSDLGSGSPALLPTQPGTAHTNLLVEAGKDATIYLLDRDNLGHWQAGNDSQIVQSFKSGAPFSFSSPAFWNNTVYFSFMMEPVEAFHYDPQKQLLGTTPTSTSGSIMIDYPGASPSVSANGATDGIVWVLQNAGRHAILRAFDANDLADELYDSNMSPQRDQAGPSVKFAVPTVADGKVFVGADGEIDIYGLLN